MPTYLVVVCDVAVVCINFWYALQMNGTESTVTSSAARSGGDGAGGSDVKAATDDAAGSSAQPVTSGRAAAANNYGPFFLEYSMLAE